MKDKNKTKAQLIQELSELRQRIKILEGTEKEPMLALEALQASRERYYGLFENVPISLWEEDFSNIKIYLDDLRKKGITDIRGYFENNLEAVQNCVEMVRIVDINQATLELYQAKSKHELMRGLRYIFREETYDVFREQLIALAEGHTRFESERLTHTLEGNDRCVYLILSVAPGYEDTWARVLLSISDVTERKRMENELRQSEARLAEAQRIAHLGYWDWDIPKNTLSWSDEIYHIFGLTPEQFSGTYEAFLNSVHPEDRQLVRQAVNAALYERKPYNIEHRIVLPDRITRVVREKAEVTFDKNSAPIRMMGTVHDVTEYKNTEDELRAISNRLVNLQEEERHTLSQELHDEIGQSLTVIKLQLDRALRLPPQQLEPTLNEVKTMVNELIKQVRNLSLTLRPAMLEHLGLMPTLLWHFDHYANKAGIKVNFKQLGLERRFPLETSIAAYRIVQEALTNVERYAEVNEATIRAWVDQNILYLLIQDQGTGFDLGKVPPEMSIGLYGMRERALALGGKLTVESTPGGGTTIKAELPISGTSDPTTEGNKHDNHSVSG